MESNVSNVLFSPSIKWELKYNGKPLHKKRLIKFTQFILQNENWVAENPDNVGKFCIYVEEIPIKTKKIKNVCQTLLKKFPQLFPPRVTVQINEEVRQISKLRLEKCSEVLSLMVNGSFGEAHANMIHLKGFEGIESKEITCFLDYLENHSVNFDEVKVAQLLRISHLYGVNDLFTACLDQRFIYLEYSDILDELLIILNELYLLDLHVELYKLFDFKILLDKISSFLDVLASEEKELFNSPDCNDSQKETFIDPFIEYLKLIQKSFTLDIRINFEYVYKERNHYCPSHMLSFSDEIFEALLTDSIYRSVNLSWVELNKEVLTVLVELNKKISINELIIEKNTYTDDDLEKLALCLPNIESLTIHNEFITRIPDTWLQKLQKLDCGGCYGLKELEAPLLKDLVASGCTNLERITASNAIFLRCWRCVSLLVVKAFKAEEFSYSECYKLKHLIVNKACKIENIYDEKLPAACKIEYVD